MCREQCIHLIIFSIYSYKNKAQYHQKKKTSKIIFTGAKSGNVKGVSKGFGTQKGA